MLSLPTDPILKITSYLSLTNLKAFSRTSHQIRNRCGMLKLNELYGVSLEAFKKLQADFEFKSCWSRELSSEEMLNIYLARLSNYHPSIKENITMEMAPSITNPFAPIVTRFTLCQAFDDSFLLTEDIKPLISNLSSNQFIAAIRLGKSIAYVEVPKDKFFFKTFYYRYVNSDAENIKCNITYPIKEIHCFFKDYSNFSDKEIFALQKAAENVVLIKKRMSLY